MKTFELKGCYKWKLCFNLRQKIYEPNTEGKYVGLFVAK